MAKFARILAFMGLGSDKEAVTEAHLQAAEDKIAQLEQEKTTAETSLATTAKERDQAKTDLSAAQGQLTTANDKVATLEDWKRKAQATDTRDEDDSNDLDDDSEPKAAFEVAASQAIARAKRNLSEK